MRVTQFLAIRSVSGWITVLALLVMILFGVSTYTYKKELKKYSLQGTAKLELFVTYLKGVLEKYESLPELLARDDQIVSLLDQPAENRRIEAFNKYLETINDISNASDTYIMDKDGLTIASSNWNTEHSFVGRNFNYRPYFQEAMEGQLGRYFALGITTSKRGYYFAYPVRKDGQILGAVVIKIKIDIVEKQWEYHDETFMVTDPDNVIFMATTPQWRFRIFGDIDLATRALIVESKRYPNSDLLPLHIKSVKKYPFGEVINLYHDNDTFTTYLKQSVSMEKAGGDVQILSDIKPIRKKILEANVFIGSIILFGYLLLALFNQRRLRLAELKRFENQARRVLQEANEKLESRVLERTRELTELNRKLLKEIKDRKETEEMLKKTRSELVHAAKMATLGQLSAGINHELNQPLSAIRSYADNGRQLLLKGRSEDAVSNMEQISELTDRMAQIGVQLKAFSRKTSGKLEIIPLHGAIDGALEILTPILKRSGVKIRSRIEPESIEVFANQVLLQQVLVNILSNAIQAMEDEQEKEVDLYALTEEDMVMIRIVDTGPGITAQNISRIFEPFFTTKQSGKGLGLGLTITDRIIREMGGEIYAEPSQKGARFTIILPTTVN